jgi:hypothetical protein
MSRFALFTPQPQPTPPSNPIQELSSYDLGYGNQFSMVALQSDVLMLAYTGPSTDGYIRTFEIDLDYSVSLLDELEHDESDAQENSLAMINDHRAILAYNGNGFNGYVKTISTDGFGENITVSDSLNHEADAYDNSIVRIDGTHAILAFGDSNTDGTIKTFSFDAIGNNLAVIDDLEHDTNTARGSSLAKLDDSHYVLAYETSSDHGQLSIFSIDGSYNITEEYSSMYVSSGKYSDSSLVHLGGGIFAVAYTNDTAATVRTFSVSTSPYGYTNIDSLEHDTTLSDDWGDHSLIALDSTTLALCYHSTTTVNGPAIAKVFTVDANGDNITEEYRLEHDTRGNWNSAVRIDDTHFALAYQSGSSTAKLKTFSVNL